MKPRRSTRPTATVPTTGVVLTLAIVIPTALLLNPLNSFSDDWWSHFFAIGYFGEFIRQHGIFPTLMSTNVIIGAPNGVFYAPLFYPIAGLFSALIGANLGVRLLLIGVETIETLIVYRTARVLGGDRALSYSITIAVNASIYALTNIYNRGDLTEFVGIALLTASVAAWLRLPFVESEERWQLVAILGLLMGLAASSNPVVTLLGNGSLAFIILVTLIFVSNRSRGFLLRCSVGVVLIELIILSPWLYAYLKYQPMLGIRSLISGGPTYYPGIDDVSVRFLPYAFDGRMGGASLPSTPHLDAQVNSCLVLLLGFLMFEAVRLKISWRALCGTVICASAALAVAIYSAVPNLGAALHVLSTIQFAYRLVSYVNLLLTAAIFLTLRALRGSIVLRSPRYVILLLIIATLAVQTTMYKESRANILAQIVPNSGLFSSRDALITIWQTATDYAIPVSSVSTLSPSTLEAQRHVVVPVGTGEHFGVPGQVRFSAPVGSLVITNVQSFPWTRLVVDGIALDSGKTITVPGPVLRLGLAFRSARSEPQSLSVVIAPDLSWMILRSASCVLVFSLVAWLVFRALTDQRNALRNAIQGKPMHSQ